LSKQATFLRLLDKLRVLTYYGKNKTLQCRWPHCEVVDLDMLTLDHIKDDGAKNRQSGGRRRAGSSIHRWVISHGFPAGLQTYVQTINLRKSR